MATNNRNPSNANDGTIAIGSTYHGAGYCITILTTDFVVVVTDKQFNGHEKRAAGTFPQFP